jgi:hypothetical protein
MLSCRKAHLSSRRRLPPLGGGRRFARHAQREVRLLGAGKALWRGAPTCALGQGLCCCTIITCRLHPAMHIVRRLH